MTVHVDLELYERALSGEGRWALTAPGTSRRRPTDPGFGPHGRHVAERGRRGVAAPGIDTRAAAATWMRGAPTRRHDVFGQIPGAGRWHYTPLVDGNLGIGGDPVPVLRRTREPTRPGWIARVEFDRRRAGWTCGPVRLETRNGIGPWLRWARVGIERAADLAAEAGLRVRDTTARAGRHVAWLGAQ